MDIQARNKYTLILLFIGIVTVCFCMPGYLYGQTPGSEELFQRGMHEQAGRPIEETKQIFEQVTTLDPNHDRAWYELAKIAYSQKKYDMAERALRNAIKAKPDSTLYWLSLADVYKADEQFGPLAGVFDQLSKLEPDVMDYYLDKAYACYLNKAYGEALKTYEETEQKFGLNAAIITGKNTIFLDTGHPGKAFKETKAFLKQAPDDVEPYLILANLHINKGNPKKALHTLSKVSARDPRIHLSRSAALRTLGQWAASTDELHQVFRDTSLSVPTKSSLLLSLLNTYPEDQKAETGVLLGQDLVHAHTDNPKAYAVLGDMLARSDQKQAATEQLSKALTLDNKMMPVWEEYLQLNLNLGNAKLLQQKGQEAAELFPSNALIALFTGYGFMLDNKYQAARPFMERALDHADPRNKALTAQIYSNLGQIYNTLNMHEVSDAAFEESLAIDSNNTVVLNNYAYFLTLRQKDLNKALKMGERANKLSPNNPTFQDTYAWALFHKARYPEALKWMEKAIHGTDQASATMLNHYGDILLKLNRHDEAVKNWKLALKLLSQQEEKTRIQIIKKIHDTIDED